MSLQVHRIDNVKNLSAAIPLLLCIFLHFLLPQCCMTRLIRPPLPQLTSFRHRGQVTTPSAPSVTPCSSVAWSSSTLAGAGMMNDLSGKTEGLKSRPGAIFHLFGCPLRIVVADPYCGVVFVPLYSVPRGHTKSLPSL